MVYSLLADAVLILHFSFIVFATLGGLLVLLKQWWAWLHLPAAAWGIYIEFSGGICPLTPLENWLRLEAGETFYTESFVQHYLVSIIYPGNLTSSMRWGLGAGILVLNVLLYSWVLSRGRMHARDR